MVGGVRDAAVAAGLITAARFAAGMNDLARTAAPDGVFLLYVLQGGGAAAPGRVANVGLDSRTFQIGRKDSRGLDRMLRDAAASDTNAPIGRLARTPNQDDVRVALNVRHSRPVLDESLRRLKRRANATNEPRVELPRRARNRNAATPANAVDSNANSLGSGTVATLAPEMIKS
jgi:hypothetical protein